jgi:hypothetical protein
MIAATASIAPFASLSVTAITIQPSDSPNAEVRLATPVPAIRVASFSVPILSFIP